MLNYEQKYLKYKNKYLTLKSNLDAQTGGNLYTPGLYAFYYNKNFLTNNGIQQYSSTKHTFDEYTNAMGPCSMFFRVGSTVTGGDLLNTYNTVYPNNPTLSLDNLKKLFNIENKCGLTSFKSENLPFSNENFVLRASPNYPENGIRLLKIKDEINKQINNVDNKVNGIIFLEKKIDGTFNVVDHFN